VTLKASTRQKNSVLIIDIVGELRLGDGTGVLREVVNDVIGQGYKNVLLNLGSVRHIDSAGVGELMSCYTSMQNRGGRLKLMNLTKNVHNILQVTKLYTIFEVEDDEDSAVSSFH
jgi:anti-sigma B factor antagonist